MALGEEYTQQDSDRARTNANARIYIKIILQYNNISYPVSCAIQE